jgi:hypothetical protein
MSHDFEIELIAFDQLLNPDWSKTPDGDYITEDGEIITAEEYAAMVENRFAELDGMEQDVQAKALNVAAYIANTLADIETMKQRENTLKARRKAKENTVQALKRYVQNCMDAANLKKIDSPELCISIRNNAESVEISDDKKFIDWALDNNRDDLLKYADPEIRKSAVKPLLQSGEQIPYATLTRTQSVIIK